MRKIMIAIAGTTLLAGAASAQYAPPPPPGGPGYGAPMPGGYDTGAFWRGAPESPRERIQFLQDRISRGEADGSLDHHEAKRATHELENIRHWIRDMHMDNGRLTPEQRDSVQARLDQLSSQIKWMRHNGW